VAGLGAVSLLSALWIIIGQLVDARRRAGYKVEGGKPILTNFFASRLQPLDASSYAHTGWSALLITGGCMAAGAVGAYHTCSRDAHRVRASERFDRSGGCDDLLRADLGHWPLPRRSKGRAAAAGQVLRWRATGTTGPMPLGLIGVREHFGQVDDRASGFPVVSASGELHVTKAYPGLNRRHRPTSRRSQATYQTYHLMIISRRPAHPRHVVDVVA